MTPPKTILVADDELHIRRVIELKLKNHGYRVLTASNGQEALELVQAGTPDALITDINMPGINGRQLCLITDGLKDVTRFLTLIITARISDADKGWSDRLTDTRFMEKPFSPSKIVQCLDDYFSGGGS